MKKDRGENGKARLTDLLADALPCCTYTQARHPPRRTAQDMKMCRLQQRKGKTREKKK